MAAGKVLGICGCFHDNCLKSLLEIIRQASCTVNYLFTSGTHKLHIDYISLNKCCYSLKMFGIGGNFANLSFDAIPNYLQPYMLRWKKCLVFAGNI